eukprot:Skav221826  [mRNA]  locus=scaffold885:171487:174358:- [translate_table: standard]
MVAGSLHGELRAMDLPQPNGEPTIFCPGQAPRLLKSGLDAASSTPEAAPNLRPQAPKAAKAASPEESKESKTEPTETKASTESWTPTMETGESVAAIDASLIVSYMS